MYQTYKNFKNLTTLYTGETSDPSTLAIEYQKTQDPVLLAVVYCEQFAYILTQVEKYFNLTDEDKASFSVEELHKAMMNYNPQGGAKLPTLYSRYLNNRLRAETQMSNHQKRSANNQCECYEAITMNVEGVEDDRLKDLEFYHSLEQSGMFTENEIALCKIVMNDTIHIKDVDIAKQLKVSSSAITQMKRSLAKKLVSFC